MRHLAVAMLLCISMTVLVGCTTISMTIQPLQKPEADIAIDTSALADIRTVVVMPFQNSAKTHGQLHHEYLPSPPWPPTTPKRRYPYEDDGEVISDVFSTELAKSFAFKMLEWKRLKDLIQEQRLQTSDLFAAENAVELGRLIGAEAMLFGRVNVCCFDKQYRHQGGNRIDQELAFVNVDFRLVSIETGELIVVGHHELSSQNLLRGPITMTNQEIIRNPSKYSDAIPSLDHAIRQLTRECVDPIKQAKKR